MYKIQKSDHIINSIHDPIWKEAERADIMTINWDIEGYTYLPKTVAYVMYSEKGLHVKMTTDEKPLRATETTHNGRICEDSCMEFFIRPNENDPRYINFEINPIGTMYVSIRYDRYDFEYLSESAEYFNLVSEITSDSWALMYTIPFDYIDRLYGAHTKNMLGNFYKCGGRTEHPHYASYFPVKLEEPDFHIPSTFGEFVLK